MFFTSSIPWLIDSHQILNIIFLTLGIIDRVVIHAIFHTIELHESCTVKLKKNPDCIWMQRHYGTKTQIVRISL